jgi:lysophospholipase L1-like esterase
MGLLDVPVNLNPLKRSSLLSLQSGLDIQSPIFTRTLFANAPTISNSGPGGTDPMGTTAHPVSACGRMLKLTCNTTVSSGNTIILNTNATTNGMAFANNMPIQHVVASPMIPSGTVITGRTASYPSTVTLTLSNNITGTITSGDEIGLGANVVNMLGFNGTYKTQFSQNYYQNNINATWTPPDYAVEFDHYGTAFSLSYRAASTSATFWVWVDGQPTTVAPTTYTGLSGGSKYYFYNVFNASDNAGSFTASIATATMTVTGTPTVPLCLGMTITGTGVTAGTTITALGTGLGGAGTYTVSPSQTASSTTMNVPARWRRVRVYIQGGDFGGMVIGKQDTIMQPQYYAPRVAFFGDSWTEGAAISYASFFQSFPWQTMQTLGWGVPFKCGQGGTGYVATGGGGGKAAFTDATRLSRLVAVSPDIVVITGSINDSASSGATITTACTTVINTIRASLPNCLIVVLGVQSEPSSMTSTALAAVDLGIAAACSNLGGTAAGIFYYSMMAEGFCTGSTNSGTPGGVGNSDVMVYSDGAHLTPTQGVEYMARWAASKIAASVAANVR